MTTPKKQLNYKMGGVSIISGTLAQVQNYILIHLD